MKAVDRLISLLTQHDAKQSAKRRGTYSPYALGQYIAAAHEWNNAYSQGIDPMRALAALFTHNPANEKDFCLQPVRQFVKEMGWK